MHDGGEEQTLLIGWRRWMSTPWYSLGHRLPGKSGLWMDEHVVRARAGLLNILSWTALINILFLKEPTIVYILYPFVCWEFLRLSSAFKLSEHQTLSTSLFSSSPRVGGMRGGVDGGRRSCRKRSVRGSDGGIFWAQG